MRCLHCQSELMPEAKFCSNCSKAVTQGGHVAADKGLTTEFWICFFFGFLGVHRFMRGQSAVGVFMLLTAGGCGLLWLYDLVNIAQAGESGKKPSTGNTRPTARQVKCAYRPCDALRDVAFLDACSEEHQILAREERKSEMDRRSRAAENSRSTPRKSAPAVTGQRAIVCHFCQQPGGVTVRTVERNKSIRRTMLSAATGGIGGRYVKEFKCSNCRQKWEIS